MKVGISSRQTRLTQVRAGAQQHTFVVSPDSQHLAYFVKGADKWLAVIDDTEGPSYEKVAEGALLFSPNSKRVAYVGLRNGKWRVVLDGEEGAEYDAITKRSLVFSLNSRHLGFVARRGREYFAVVDGREGLRHEQIGAGSFVFGPDGERSAYVAFRGEKNFVVVDGSPSPEYDAIANSKVVFSPDARLFAYIARVGERCRIVQDGLDDSRWFDNIGDIVFSPDSRHVAFCAAPKSGGQWHIYLDRRQSPPHVDILKNTLVFSPDSQHFLYVAKEHDGCVAVIDERCEALFDVIVANTIHYSPNSTRLAYVGVRDEHDLLMLDGSEQACEGVADHGPVFSPDSVRLAYGTMRRTERGDRWKVVVDGTPGTEYDGIDDITFSPDSKHYAYMAREQQQDMVVFDGIEGRLGIPTGFVSGSRLVFSRPNRVQTLAGRGGKILRVETREGGELEEIRAEEAAENPPALRQPFVRDASRIGQQLSYEELTQLVPHMKYFDRPEVEGALHILEERGYLWDNGRMLFYNSATGDYWGAGDLPSCFSNGKYVISPVIPFQREPVIAPGRQIPFGCLLLLVIAAFVALFWRSG